MISKEQLEIILEVFEQYNEELSNNSHGTLFSEQWEVYEYLKMLNTGLLGLDLESAAKKLETENKIYRISRVDNTPMMITCDFVPERLNLEIEDGKIINVTNG